MATDFRHLQYRLLVGYSTIKLIAAVVCVLPASRMHRLKVELPADEAGDVLMVKHLANEVCIETGVDLWNQVLTFKGWLIAHTDCQSHALHKP